MSHPFGDLLTQHIHRKHGLSQARLAEGILQPAIVISQMCQGKRLTGPLARDRVLAIIGWLAGQQVLDSVTEANALLQAAGMAGLAPGNPVEAQLLERLAAQTSTATVPDRTQSHRLPGIRHNLPLHLTGFIGRTREMAEVTQLLHTTRILTLVGAGGCGKTRLALHIAAGAVEAFADGVWWIDLAPVTEPALVPNALATVLGVHERPGESLLMRVGKVLQDKLSMVVLDNCEHLLDACAQLVVTLVQACPQLVILATSREVLAVPGETSYPVPPLTLPHRPGATPDVLMKYDAIRLFVERARAVQPSFALTGQNATVIVEICRQLDGMPLALELAAARVRAITPGQLLLHLDDRFRLLVGGNRTAHPRQQTLYATINWSYDLLAEAERRVFRRLAVFVDGWTLEAAEAVCAGPDIPQRDVVALLLNLADKSLVVTEAAQGQQRYRMLETIRQFAVEQLRMAGEAEVTVRQHRDWFLALALKAEPYLTGPQELEWLARLEADHANLKAALDRSLAQHDGE